MCLVLAQAATSVCDLPRPQFISNFPGIGLLAHFATHLRWASRLQCLGYSRKTGCIRDWSVWTKIGAYPSKRTLYRYGGSGLNTLHRPPETVCLACRPLSLDPIHGQEQHNGLTGMLPVLEDIFNTRPFTYLNLEQWFVNKRAALPRGIYGYSARITKATYDRTKGAPDRDRSNSARHNWALQSGERMERSNIRFMGGSQVWFIN
ncbi:hypothetical protein F4780DRAFT_369622 [Xylariomycetidae sp. FL0641]|nr:hypothetical protein F4780DRAFT_369622 [Xylariomycetidae sp. FL0641]